MVAFINLRTFAANTQKEEEFENKPNVCRVLYCKEEVPPVLNVAALLEKEFIQKI